MSGGHFDYQEYHIRDIASQIVRDIHDALEPKPEKVRFHYVHAMEQVDKGWFRGVHIPESIDTIEDVLNYLGDINCSKPIKLENEDNLYQIGNTVYKVTEGYYMDYPDHEWRLDLKPETIEFMQKGLKVIKEAAAYTHAIDYMMSGDIGEDDLQSAFEEELKYIEESTKYQEDIDDED